MQHALKRKHQKLNSGLKWSSSATADGPHFPVSRKQWSAPDRFSLSIHRLTQLARSERLSQRVTVLEGNPTFQQIAA